MLSLSFNEIVCYQKKKKKIQLPLKKGKKKIQLLDSTRSIGIDLWRKYGQKKKKITQLIHITKFSKKKKKKNLESQNYGKLFLIKVIVTHTYTI